MAIGLRYFSLFLAGLFLLHTLRVCVRTFFCYFFVDVFKCFWPFIDFVKRYLPPLLLLLSSPFSLLSVISSRFSPTPSPSCLFHLIFFHSEQHFCAQFSYTIHTLFYIQLSDTNKRAHTHTHLRSLATKLQLKLLIECIYANGSNINLYMNKCIL